MFELSQQGTPLPNQAPRAFHPTPMNLGRRVNSNPVFHHKLSSNTDTYTRPSAGFQLHQPQPQAPLQSAGPGFDQCDPQAHQPPSNGHHQHFGNGISRHRPSTNPQAESGRRAPPYDREYTASVHPSDVSREGDARLRTRRAGELCALDRMSMATLMMVSRTGLLRCALKLPVNLLTGSKATGCVFPLRW